MRVIFGAVFLLFSTIKSSFGGCGGAPVILEKTEGVIISPAPYEAGGVCIWIISVPTDQRIIFYFTSYTLESSFVSSPRHKDYCTEKDTRIEFKDSSTDQPWIEYCQSGLPDPIATTKSSLYIEFNVSDGDSRSQFSARYITLPFKQTIDLREASNDTITSPEFPGKYPRNSHFVWSLIAPSGYRLKIEFTKFDISDDGGYDCPKDALVVRDGPSVQSELLTRLCGSGRYTGLPQAMYSSTNFMTLEFVSDVYGMDGDYVGFKANVTKEIRLYVIILPCAIGILIISLLVAAFVFKYRRGSSGAGHPRMQMSLLKEADHFKTTQISEVDTPYEANLPVYRPTTQQIKEA
ncbi:dorsal-ventral patterning tolloid-like protein 1 [Montipora foliosa]|uniref:dorsal-ventral patterning tolloid-like protein 1 n=1 Tax=Montipora foliosa TaxID=591990 RepID=UPI0035F13568